MKKVIKKKTVLIMIGLVFSVFDGSVSAAIDRLFNYTIKATGNEDITTYPDQEFTWTVTGTATETSTGGYALNRRYFGISGYYQIKTYYLYPPFDYWWWGSGITDWSCTVYYSKYGGGDAGTYIDEANNRLVIRVRSGGYYDYNTHTAYDGSYSATYYIYGRCSNWGVFGTYGFHKSETYYLYPAASGQRIIDWSKSTRYAWYGGEDAGTYIDEANNRLVIRVFSGGRYDYNTHTAYDGGYSASYFIYCEPKKIETTTVTATDSGSGVVNADEGDKLISTFSAEPAPEQGGTVSEVTYSITDDNDGVTTWILGDQVYASTDYSETVTEPWSDTETGSSSVNFDEGDKYITTSILVAPNNDTTWSVTDDSDYVDTWMDGNKLYARAINQPPVANAGLDQTVILGQTVTFDGGGSYDPDGTIASYDWDFGDASFDSGQITTHEYSSAGIYTVTLTVTDDDGATGTDTATVTVQTPAEATQDLISDVQDLDLPHGIENSLVSKLDAAIKSLDKGRENAAKNQLNAFINHVNAQRDKEISDADADALIAAVNDIIAVLSSP